jgi:hypothetical protein
VDAINRARIAKPNRVKVLALAIMMCTAGSCGSLHLNSDPQDAPSPDFTRVWSPEPISADNEAAPKLSELNTGLMRND